MTQLIALTSVRGRSGKDTLIEQLQARGLVVDRVAFGDILKEQCAEELDNWTTPKDTLLQWFHNDMKDREVPDLAIKHIKDGPYRRWLMDVAERNDDGRWMETARSPRWHLQKYGTDYRRNYLNNPHVWLQAGLDHIKGLVDAGAQLIVVTDLRQRNEYCALVSLTHDCKDQTEHPDFLKVARDERIQPCKTVRLHRMWFVPGVDDAEYHVTDVDLIGFSMSAVILNVWGNPSDMVDQLIRQGGLK